MATMMNEISNAKVVPQAEWVAARKELLKKEREFTHLRDELSRQRRELPWERVDKKYVFDGPKGKQTLADLFDGRSQLIVYHFMLGPGWKEGCPSCSYLADTFDGAAVHLAQRDAALAAVSRAPWPEIDAFKKRMGWRLPWVSSFGNDFNSDYHVSFTKEEIAKGNGKVNYNYEMAEFPSEEGPGLSVFHKNKDGEIFHTYSTYARGLDILVTTYNFLDMTPKGRDEDGLPWPMAWVRHHDRYSDGKLVDIKSPSAAPASPDSSFESMLSEFQEEAAVTKRVLDRVPADKLTWKPHARSMSLGQLALHIATVPGSLTKITREEEFDISQVNFNPPQPKDVKEIQAALEQSISEVEECLKGLTEEKAQGHWRLMLKDKEISSRPRIKVLRSIMLNHWYHHRGQLSVYLRLLNVPVPVIYGPSADESPFA